MEKKTKIHTLIAYIFDVYLNQNKVSRLATVRMSNGDYSKAILQEKKVNIIYTVERQKSKLHLVVYFIIVNHVVVISS